MEVDGKDSRISSRQTDFQIFASLRRFRAAILFQKSAVQTGSSDNLAHEDIEEDSRQVQRPSHCPPRVNRQIAKYFEAAAARLPKEARNRRKEWKRREIWRKQQLSSAGLILSLLCGSYAEGRTDVKIHRYRPEAESVSRK